MTKPRTIRTVSDVVSVWLGTEVYPGAGDKYTLEEASAISASARRVLQDRISGTPVEGFSDASLRDYVRRRRVAGRAESWDLARHECMVLRESWNWMVWNVPGATGRDCVTVDPAPRQTSRMDEKSMGVLRGVLASARVDN